MPAFVPCPSILVIPVPEFIDPVFPKTSPKRSFSVIHNERIELVFAKTGSIISGTDVVAVLKGLSHQMYLAFEDMLGQF